MTTNAAGHTPPVRKTITVNAGVDEAFDIFTNGIDSWWPRSHHIGKSPMKQGIIEGRVGGRCYSIQEDGTDCDWGQVLVWEPPNRLVIAWKITVDWRTESDLSRSSEVEIRFTSLGQESTHVTLEHRDFDRHGAGAATMRQSVDAEGGWGGLLALYAARVAVLGRQNVPEKTR